VADSQHIKLCVSNIRSCL